MDNSNPKLMFLSQVLTFVLLLYRDVTISRKSIVFIMNSLEKLVCNIVILVLLAQVIKILSDKGVDSAIIHDVVIAMKEVQFYFQDFRTESQIEKLLLKKRLLIKPKYVLLGSRNDDKTDLDDADDDKNYSSYIPLTESLRKYLELDNVLYDILKYKYELKKDKKVIRNVVQTEFWD